MHLRQRHLLHNLHWLQKVIHWWDGKATRPRFREHLRYVERNDKDASKPVARHLNLPNHSKKHMAGCGLFLHLGSAESLKTQEQKFIFQIGTLSPHGINERFSFNQVTLVFSTTTPKFLQSLCRRANARNVSSSILYGGQFTLSTQLLIQNYPVIRGVDAGRV